MVGAVRLQFVLQQLLFELLDFLNLILKGVHRRRLALDECRHLGRIDLLLLAKCKAGCQDIDLVFEQSLQPRDSILFLDGIRGQFLDHFDLVFGGVDG